MGGVEYPLKFYVTVNKYVTQTPRWMFVWKRESNDRRAYPL